jgi:hypothetical protein
MPIYEEGTCQICGKEASTLGFSEGVTERYLALYPNGEIICWICFEPMLEQE